MLCFGYKIFLLSWFWSFCNGWVRIFTFCTRSAALSAFVSACAVGKQVLLEIQSLQCFAHQVWKWRLFRLALECAGHCTPISYHEWGVWRAKFGAVKILNFRLDDSFLSFFGYRAPIDVSSVLWILRLNIKIVDLGRCLSLLQHLWVSMLF